MICGGLPFFGVSDADLYKDVTNHKGDLFKKNQNVPDRTKNIINIYRKTLYIYIIVINLCLYYNYLICKNFTKDQN